MQAQASQQAQQPYKPTDAQVNAQIENMRWGQKQQEHEQVFQHQYQLAAQTISSKQFERAHTQFLIEHMWEPTLVIVGLVILAYAMVRICYRSIQAGCEKNRDDNLSDQIKNRDGNNAEHLRASVAITEMSGKIDKLPGAIVARFESREDQAE